MINEHLSLQGHRVPNPRKSVVDECAHTHQHIMNLDSCKKAKKAKKATDNLTRRPDPKAIISQLKGDFTEYF